MQLHSSGSGEVCVCGLSARPVRKEEVFSSGTKPP